MSLLKFKRFSKKEGQQTSEPSTSTSTPENVPLSGRPLGLRVLHEPQQNVHIVNLILVHGLGGSSLDTWTEPRSKTFWPDLLHDDKRFPNLRISTFGYIADWQNIFARKNALGIEGIARQLLDALYIDAEENGHRPTIFVVHSMGGLIVKNVLIYAHFDASYKKIFENLRAFIFLGTPHRGADNAILLSKLLSLSFSGKTFVNQLKPGCHFIKTINEQFLHLTPSLELVSYWEQAGIFGLGVIVTEDSARLGLLGEKVVPLNGDHLGIPKFTSVTDEKYISVSGHISIINKKLMVPVQKDSIVHDIPPKRPARYEVLPEMVQKNEHFFGRKEILEELCFKLSDNSPKQHNHRVALFGMGGVGKTQIAIEYVITHENTYSHVFWISASKDSDLMSGFGQIAQEIGYQFSEESDREMLRKEVLMWFKKETGWLLVLDNLDDITIVKPYLPDTSSLGHVLITTRNPNVTSIPAQPLKVDVFPTDEASELLLLRADLNDNPSDKVKAEAVKIVTELGFLALAIEQAAAYIRVKLKDIFKYLDLYHKRRKTLLEERPNKNWDYPKEVATTWSVAFETVSNNPDAKLLLNLFAFLNPDGILVEFLEAAIASDVAELEQLKRTITNTIKFVDALAELEQFSLISRSRDGGAISIHRLVQAVLQDNLNAEELSSCRTMVVALISNVFPWFDEVNRQQCRHFQNQIVAPLSWLIQLDTDHNLDFAHLLLRVAWFLWHDGKFADAEIFQMHACQALPVDTDPSIESFAAATTLAVVYHSNGRLAEAAVLLEKVLEEEQKALNADHPTKLATITHLAMTYRDLGKMKKAASLLEEVAELQRRIAGNDNENTLAILNNLAITYRDAGEMVKAASLFENVLEAETRILGNRHSDTLITINNLAITYRDLGEMEKAVGLLENVSEVNKEILGPEHPKTLTVVGNLALLYVDLGAREEAAALLEGVLEVQLRIFPEEHPRTLRTMNNLAAACFHLGEIPKAIALYEEALDIHKRKFGESHPKTVLMTTNLAYIRQTLGETTEQQEVSRLQK